MKRFVLAIVFIAMGILPAAGVRAQMPDALPDVNDLPMGSTLQPRTDEAVLRNTPPPMSGPVDATQYQLGPGDLIQVQMWGRVSRSWLLPVGPEGVLMLPGSGTIVVGGRSLAQARAEVMRVLASQFRGVGMDVRLARPREFRIYLTGQVKAPGATLATGAYRLFDVLPPSSFQDNASRRHVTVLHRDGTRETGDLDLFHITGVSSLNPWLRDGDVINVPVAGDYVYALGALGRPQRFELGPQDSLLTLFRLAGDPTPAADASRAMLLRWKDPLTPETTWVRLEDVYSRRTNPALREGDRLYVYYLPQYHQQQQVYISGEVNRPGPYPVVEGKHHLSDLVSSAGGFLPTADLSAINVHRHATADTEKDPELERLLRLSRDQLTQSEYDALNTKLAGLREGYRVEWNRLKASPRELDLLLRDGDIVTVDRLVNSIRVDGQVSRPGILTFRPGQRVRDYIQQAGGFTDRAWPSHVRVTRAVTGQTLPVNNVKSLDPGDFVWIPERPDRTALDHFRDTLTALAQIATVIIAIRSIK